MAQTYQHWEYVIVNNCSTDRSLEIAQEYAAQDERIRIVDNDQFLAQMPNWNHAMRQISAQSKYCKVVHADDWLFPECVAQMVALAEAYPSVGLVGAYRLDEDVVNLDGLPYPSTVVSGRKISQGYSIGDAFYCSARQPQPLFARIWCGLGALFIMRIIFMRTMKFAWTCYKRPILALCIRC